MTPSPAAAAAPASQKSGKLGWVSGLHRVSVWWACSSDTPSPITGWNIATGQGFPTPFQAVVTQQWRGVLRQAGGLWYRGTPTLTDVFYIVSKTDPTTKQVTNVLVKRGKELHGPDRMYLNPNQIVFVEPVGPDSKVAQLINQAGH